uniref:Uncharacterized protein n=1 Tax=Strongyloides papillosus TaxID=174720 RepID=A0A0N5BAY5_STREA
MICWIFSTTIAFWALPNWLFSLFYCLVVISVITLLIINCTRNSSSNSKASSVEAKIRNEGISSSASKARKSTISGRRGSLSKNSTKAIEVSSDTTKRQDSKRELLEKIFLKLNNTKKVGVSMPSVELDQINVKQYKDKTKNTKDITSEMVIEDTDYVNLKKIKSI